MYKRQYDYVWNFQELCMHLLINDLHLLDRYGKDWYIMLILLTCQEHYDTSCQYMLRQYRVIHDVNTCWDTIDRYMMSIHAETIQSNTWCQYMLRQYRVVHHVNTFWDNTDRYMMSIHAETIQSNTWCQYMLRHYRSIHDVNTCWDNTE